MGLGFWVQALFSFGFSHLSDASLQSDVETFEETFKLYVMLEDDVLQDGNKKKKTVEDPVQRPEPRSSM